MDPSGSSSSSGVGSSIRLALASSGTGTDGSILSLLSVSNLVGIKPSVGLTSRFLLFQFLNTKTQLGKNMILWPFAPD
jgi:amidase